MKNDEKRGIMRKETFKNFVENQEELRIRLFRILKKDPKPLVNVAAEIGIGKATLFRFLKDEQDVDFVRLIKIEKWLEKQELKWDGHDQEGSE